MSVLVALSGLAWSLPTRAQVDASQEPAQACDPPFDREITLYGEKVGPGRFGYGLVEGEPTIPGPTIELTEGECVAITLVNKLTHRRLSFHPHGVDYTVASDGTRLNRSCVGPGRSRTYVISSHGPTTRSDGTVDPGSAGYWHYHDHCMGTPHGTVGVKSGLFAALIVRRAGDPLPDREPVVLVMNDMAFNLQVAPNTPMPEANMGERVEFVVIGHGDNHHTFHLHGHRWTDSRTGLPTGLSDPGTTIDNKTVGPADSFGFQVVAGEHVGPGAWMYHCHVQGHSDAGMAGIFVVRTAGGELTGQTRATIQQWGTEHGAGHH
ncbi:MAG: multicopper oxidase domain-containing protein [Actinomycetota bacterium]